MKQMIRTMSVVFGVVLVATFFALNTNAQCGASDGQVTTAAATSLLERSAPLRNASQTSPTSTAVELISCKKPGSFWRKVLFSQRIA